MRIFCDLEFHAAGGKRIRPLSIALAAEDGASLYRVFDDDDAVNRAMGDPWLRENVMPYLPVDPAGPKGKRWRWDDEHPDFAAIRPRDAIAAQVCEFVLSRPGARLWGWFCDFDYVAVAQLYGGMSDLPEGFPMLMLDLEQERIRLGSPDVPEQAAGAHNALADALHMIQVASFLDAYGARREAA